MKNLTFILLFSILLSSCFTIKIPNPRYAINHQLSFQNISDDEIFDKTEMWIARTFVDSRSVLEVKNRNAKMMYGNCILTLSDAKEYQFEVSMEYHIKNGVLKMETSNINMIGYYKSGYSVKKHFVFFENGIPKKIKEKFHKKIEELNADLEKYIKTPIW